MSIQRKLFLFEAPSRLENFRRFNWMVICSSSDCGTSFPCDNRAKGTKKLLARLSFRKFSGRRECDTRRDPNLVVQFNWTSCRFDKKTERAVGGERLWGFSLLGKGCALYSWVSRGNLACTTYSLIRCRAMSKRKLIRGLVRGKNSNCSQLSSMNSLAEKRFPGAFVISKIRRSEVDW